MRLGANRLGLDVYVGPLTRYYLGNWANDVAQMLEDDSVLESLRQRFGVDDLTAVETKTARRSLDVRTAEEAVERIQAWRKKISEVLGLEEPLDWPESNELPYATRKPCWDGYQGLLLWAAYEDAGQIPPLDLPGGVDEDPALQRSRADLRASRYPHLLGNTEIWLPGDYDLAFRATDPTGQKNDFGFAGSLFKELLDLNQRTWRADLDTIIDWYDKSVEYGSCLEACARFGFAVFYRLSLTAYEERSPMVLDY